MRFHTADDVADILGISTYSVMDLARSYARGNPRGLRGSKVLREWRFTDDDLSLFMERNRSPEPVSATPVRRPRRRRV